MVQDRPEKLIRAVGLGGLVLMCINAVVGSGVFLLPSESFKLLGPFSLWGPLLFAIPVFVLVLCFAEASSHFDQPGGAYLYARTAFGDFIGFETGWMNWLARVTSLAALSNGFVIAISRLAPGAAEAANRAAIIVGTLVTLALIHYFGVKYGAASIFIFNWGKLVPLIGFIVVALIVFRYNPIPASLTLPGAGTDWGDAAMLLLFAYAGFENMGVPAGEFKNPRRDVPLALLWGTLAIGALYSLAQLAAMSALPDLSQTATPIADAAAALVGPFGATIVTIGAVLSMAGTNSGTMLEGSRLLYAIAHERRPFTVLSRVHPRFRTPWVAILVHTSVAIPLALGGTFAKLAVLSALARMTTYLVTCAAIPRLRKLSDQGFRVPGGLFIPVLGVVISIILIFMKVRNLVAAVIAISVGAILYGISAAMSNRKPAHDADE